MRGWRGKGSRRAPRADRAGSKRVERDGARSVAIGYGPGEAGPGKRGSEDLPRTAPCTLEPRTWNRKRRSSFGFAHRMCPKTGVHLSVRCAKVCESMRPSLGLAGNLPRVRRSGRCTRRSPHAQLSDHSQTLHEKRPAVNPEIHLFGVGTR